MEKILENEINEFYMTHAIRFPEQLKITDEKDDSIWCIQREITKVFHACLQIFLLLQKNPKKQTQSKNFSVRILNPEILVNKMAHE